MYPTSPVFQGPTKALAMQEDDAVGLNAGPTTRLSKCSPHLAAENDSEGDAAAGRLLSVSAVESFLVGKASIMEHCSEA